MKVILQERGVTVSETLVIVNGHTFSTPNITSMYVKGPGWVTRVFSALFFLWLMYLAGGNHPLLAFMCFVLAVATTFHANTLVIATAAGETKALHAYPGQCRRIKLAILKAMHAAAR